MLEINHVIYYCPDCKHYMFTDDLPGADYNNGHFTKSDFYCYICFKHQYFKNLLTR